MHAQAGRREGQGLIAGAEEVPSVSRLIEEFRRTLSEGDWYGLTEKAEEVRLCIWDGQSSDGRKWDRNQKRGKATFPWNGASDARTFFADSICAEHADQCYNAFWRAEAKLQAIGVEDIAVASAGTQYLDWLKSGPNRNDLDTEVELAANYNETFGWFGLHVTWDRVIARRLREVTLEEIQGMADGAEGLAQENPELSSVLASLPALIADPSLEEHGVKAVQYLYDIYLRQNLPDGVVPEDITALSPKRAKKALKELRENQTTDMPVPYLERNTPSIRTLKPYRDIMFPPESGDIQDAPVIFTRYFYTEAELRTMALAEGWDMEWVEEAIKTIGSASIWEESPHGQRSWEWQSGAGNSWLIEIVYAYYKTVDEDGITHVNHAVFSPHITGTKDDFMATWGPLGYKHGRYPIAIGRTEKLDRAIATSRGTAHILQTVQSIEKSQFDSIVDLTSLAVVPPVQVPKGIMGRKLTFGPAVQNEYTPGREAKFMQVPGQGASLAFATLEALNKKVDERFGRFSATTNPATSQLKLEARVARFLQPFAEAFSQCHSLTLQYAPELFLRVTGMEGGDAFDGRHDFALHFDAAQLNPDLMEKKLASYSALLPEDTAGTIDRAKLTQMKMAMIDPMAAKELTTDKQGATDKIFRETQADLTAIMAGLPVQPRDATNDPTGQMRMQFTQQLLQGADPEKLKSEATQKRLQDYVANIQMAISQQENKQIGRVGVKPEQPQGR